MLKKLTSNRFTTAAISLASVVALQLMSVSQPQAASTDFRQIINVSEFANVVVGKPLVRNNTSFIIEPDGTISGTYGGKMLVGNWEWVGDTFCRSLSVPARRYNCQVVETDGSDARFLGFQGDLR